MPTLEDYTDSDRSKHEIAKQVIAMTFGQGFYTGPENTISSEELAEKCPVSASTVRDLIKEVRKEYKLPIGHSNGYFLIPPEGGELDRQVQRQKRQARRSLQTAREIPSAYRHHYHRGEAPDGPE